MTPLHTIGEMVRELMLSIPLSMVRVLFLAVPVALLIWVVRLPNERTTPSEPTGRWSENLKIPAAAALVVQIIIYVVM